MRWDWLVFDARERWGWGWLYLNCHSSGWKESDKEDGLGVGDLEAVPAAGIRAKKHVIDPHEVIPRIGKLCSVVITCPARQISLF